jgi:hypothetical protein
LLLAAGGGIRGTFLNNDDILVWDSLKLFIIRDTDSPPLSWRTND